MRINYEMKLLTSLLIISLLALLQGCLTSPANKVMKSVNSNINSNRESIASIRDKFEADNPEYAALNIKYFGKDGATTLTQKMNPEFLTEEEKAIVLKGHDNYIACCLKEIDNLISSPYPDPAKSELAKLLAENREMLELLIMGALSEKTTIGEWATKRAITIQVTQEKTDEIISRLNQRFQKRHKEWQELMMDL